MDDNHCQNTTAEFLRRCRLLLLGPLAGCNRPVKISCSWSRTRGQDSLDNRKAIALFGAVESCPASVQNKASRRLSTPGCAGLTPSSGGESVLFLRKFQACAICGLIVAHANVLRRFRRRSVKRPIYLVVIEIKHENRMVDLRHGRTVPQVGAQSLESQPLEFFDFFRPWSRTISCDEHRATGWIRRRAAVA